MKQNSKLILCFVALLLVAATVIWFYKSGTTASNDAKTAGQKEAAQVYTCPMHPFVLQEKPGSCPVCGMDLVKKADQSQQDGVGHLPENIAHIALSASQRVMANVAVAEVKVQALVKEIPAAGLVQYDQSRQATVTAWVAGRIDTLYADTVGSLVSKKHPVAELYSPELFAGQQEYLLALANRDRLQGGQPEGAGQNAEAMVAAARQRLLLFGMPEKQLAQLEKTRTAAVRLPVYTPLSGVVVEKLVQRGQYLNLGDPLLRIADLSSIWVELEIYESELAEIRLGQWVDLRSNALPGQVLKGKINYIYPFLDQQTRTVKARAVLANPGMQLKPGMFVDGRISVQVDAAVTVPVTALLDSGRQQTVWVEAESNVFVPRTVQTGQRNDQFVQILSGIKPGEMVAVSGAYLIDSESQLQGGVQHKQAPEADDMDMDDMSMDDLEL
ncbi:MAG: efflux RND transporter periplasmic adaptor subunit [Trichlorobacter sp.]|nr:efflux RND transporter periplasmic adaptor subunit [Trichlorobacter sp.]